MTATRRKLLTAWLGLIAMGLIVFAPLVSQFVTAGRSMDLDTEICSTVRQHDVAHHDPIERLDACGYCQLLAHHLPLPTVPAAAVSPFFLLVLTSAAQVLSTSFTPVGAFPSGRPRDPPGLPHAIF